MARRNPARDLPAVVSTVWLAQHLADRDLRVVDGTYHLPGAGRDARREYEARHLPGAVFFDIDAVCDAQSPLPHMLPAEETMSTMAGALGLGDDSRIVVYDALGAFSAPRVWWTLRAFGHEAVGVLDGGLPKWVGEGRAVESTPVTVPTARLAARLDRTLVRGLEQMLANLDSRAEQVVDARSPGRFRGIDPEPRPGLRRGHIPGSRNLPFADLLDPVAKTLLPPDELSARFQAAGVDLERPIVATCGSGATACVLAWALHRLGHRGAAVYDGSWAEWGGRDDTPIER